MQNELTQVLNSAGLKVQYDTQCKKILAQKPVLARILKGTAKEFADFSVEEIEFAIEGTPEISTVAIAPGETNQNRITGISNEDNVPGEGVIYYDIRFYIYVPVLNERVKIIVNVEAQKKYRPGYEIVTRGIFYGSRMISAQFGTEFSKSDYNAIKKVYSIWICMDAPLYIGNTITEYHMEKTDIVGYQPVEQKAYDKISVIIITLNEKKQAANELLGLLNILLSVEKTSKEKRHELKNRYGMPINEEMEKELNVMCNLSDLVEEKGIEKGIEKVAMTLLKQGKLSDEDILEAAGITAEVLEKLKKQI